MSQKIKAVIFDMDGVLIDAKDWHYECFNQALALFGMEIERHEHLATFDGLPTSRKLEILSKERHLPRALHEFINELKQQYTFAAISRNCRPNFIHEYALSKLKDQGYHIAVASNSIRKTVGMMMEQANLTKYLDFFLSNEDVDRPKPDPQIYQTAIERLNLSPSECLVVEDNEFGIKAARESGAHVLVVDTVSDVNYANISNRIQEIEAEAC